MITPGTSTPKRGAFILLEGVDRCGKTTQVSLLVKHLLSLSLATVAYRFPDRTTQGEPLKYHIVLWDMCSCNFVGGVFPLNAHKCHVF